MTTPISLTASQLYEQRGVSDFFRILAASHPVDLLFYKSGKEVAKAMSVGEGYAEKFADGFDMFKIQNGANAQDVQVVARLGNEVSYDKSPNGDVTVTNTSGAFTQSEPVVTNAVSTVLTANTARRYLLVQNNDAVASLRVTVDGSNATASHGIKLAPGGSLELSNYVPTGAVKVIADQLTAIVTVVEG